MDLVRTLGVAINPAAAEAGGKRAGQAFRHVGTEARKMAQEEEKATQATEKAGRSMQTQARMSDLLRGTLERQNAILGSMHGAIERLNASLTREGVLIREVTTHTQKASEAISKTTNVARNFTASTDATARSLREVSTAARSAENSVRSAGNAMQRANQQARDSAGRYTTGGGGSGAAATGGGFSMPVWARGGLGALGVVGGAAGGVMAGFSLGKTELELQRIANALKFASASAADFAVNQKFVAETSEDLGLDLMATSREFAKFMAAGKGTEFTSQELRDVFLGVGKAATVLGLSTEQTSGTLNALQQMISKGTVQAEELRGQLGERLPGAFGMAARAMGVTTKELGKMLEQGQVSAYDLLPKLAKEMEKTFGPSASAASKSLNSELNRLKTSWTEFKAAVNDAGFAAFIEVLVAGVRDLLRLLTVAAQRFKDLAQILPDWARIGLNPMTAARAMGSGLRMVADRAAGPTATLGGPAVDPNTVTAANSMDRFIVAPSRTENFRAGIGSSIYELNEKTGQMENKFTNSMRNMVEAGHQAVNALNSGFESFFDRMIENPKKVGEAFRAMTSSILTDIAKILARQSIVNPIAGAIGGWLGITPDVPVGVKHTGGIVGIGGQSRLVSPSVFAGAPRFHNGLAPDEFPAILQRGEEVIPKGGRNQAPIIFNTTINVDGSKGGSPEQNKALGSEIARQMEAMIDQRIARAVMPRGVLAAA